MSDAAPALLVGLLVGVLLTVAVLAMRRAPSAAESPAPSATPRPRIVLHLLYPDGDVVVVDLTRHTLALPAPDPLETAPPPATSLNFLTLPPRG